jgi:hypothetical protein
VEEVKHAVEHFEEQLKSKYFISGMLAFTFERLSQVIYQLNHSDQWKKLRWPF